MRNRTDQHTTTGMVTADRVFVVRGVNAHTTTVGYMRQMSDRTPGTVRTPDSQNAKTFKTRAGAERYLARWDTGYHDVWTVTEALRTFDPYGGHVLYVRDDVADATRAPSDRIKAGALR